MKASPKDILLEDGCGGVLEAGADVEHHEIEDSICTVRRSDWAKKGTIAGFQRGGGAAKVGSPKVGTIHLHFADPNERDRHSTIMTGQLMAYVRDL